MKFIYDTGLRRKLFRNVRLIGSWDSSGLYSDNWTECPMEETVGPDGANVFEADVTLQTSEVGKDFSWRVLLDGPLGLDRDGIVTEQPGLRHDSLYVKFKLTDGTTPQRYYLTHVRRLGARKIRDAKGGNYGFRFAVWAPNAQAVDVVFGDRTHGYIADDGTG
ncbi:MAG TPA: hypothetical protein VFG30_16360, partial [Polyangiales bacterium]|nr:hypothetical protein [Polyangiales bacterium]